MSNCTNSTHEFTRLTDHATAPVNQVLGDKCVARCAAWISMWVRSPSSAARRCWWRSQGGDGKFHGWKRLEKVGKCWKIQFQSS